MTALGLVLALAAPSVAAEARQILDQILAVDTSHGGETRVAALIKARFDPTSALAASRRCGPTSRPPCARLRRRSGAPA